MDPTTTGFLTQLLNAFSNVFAGGFDIVTPQARGIIFVLAAVDITLVALFWALRSEDILAPFLRKLLRLGFFFFLLASWPELTKGLANGLAEVGARAAGSQTGSWVLNPSAILDHAMVLIKPIETEIARIQEGPWMTRVSVLALVLQYTLAMVAILAAFVLLALACLMTYVEFFIVSILGLILLPWGVSTHTAFLAERVIGAVIAQGVKLMVLSFIITVYADVFDHFVLPDAPALMATWLAAASALVMAILAIHAPAAAGGLLAGSPSLKAGGATASAIGAGSAALKR